ncbi:MAG TPA: aquaporin, partial [Thermoanaerobaculia bacterium]|nr:aquaporin [Thermoanaerobaculia bacterium]
MVAPTLLQRASAEAFGTFALVTGGCGAIVVNHATGALGHGGVAASFGLVIMVMIAALGHLSGAHFNPAVTLAFAVTRHFPWRDVPFYLVGLGVGRLAIAFSRHTADAEGRTVTGSITGVVHLGGVDVPVTYAVPGGLTLHATIPSVAPFA